MENELILRRKANEMKTKQPSSPRRKKREPRTTVVSFRLRQTEVNLLSQDLRQNPIAGLESLKQFTRKLSVDYARGKLVYVLPAERTVDSDARELVPEQNCQLYPNCQMSDRKFMKALQEFLLIAENWSKLRLFMLRAGWPEHLLAAHRKATTDQERLRVARQVLTEMEEDTDGIVRAMRHLQG